MLKLRSMLGLLMGAAIGLPAAAQEWPRFRGANGVGVSDARLPATFTEKDYAWKIELPGEGHSSPVLWGNRIFLTCAEKESAKRFILCINAADGTTLWKREFPSVTYAQHNDNSYASSTPAVDADHVYACWSTPQEYALIALDHEGKDVWKFGLGPYKSQHGSGTSPIVLKDMVILSNDQEGPASFLVALDSKTGKVKWRTDRHGTAMSASTPVVYHGKDGTDQVIFTQQTQGLTSVSATTGKVLWSLPDAFGLRTVGSPFVAGDVVVGTCGQGPKGGNMVAAKPDAATVGKGVVAWKTAQKTPYVPTPVCKGDLIFVWTDVGVVTCMKTSGQEVWQENVGGAYYSSPVIAGDKLYCISKKGEVMVLAAADHYQLLGKSELGEKTHATPAIAGGRMYLRTLNHLICIGSKAAG